LRIAPKSLLTCLVCLLLCLQGGCWSSAELSERAFARLLLLDYSDEGVELTLGFPLPNRVSTGGGAAGGGDSKSDNFTYVTKSGKTIAEAYRKIQADLSRKITFGQLRSVLIGRKLAEKEIQPLVDFIMRLPSIHINANLFVTDGDVKQFTKIPVTFERFPTDIMSEYAEQQVTIMITIKDMLFAIYSGGDLILPLLVFGKAEVLDSKSSGNWLGTDGAALFKQGTMIGTLNTQEMRGSLWIIGQLSSAVISVSSPTDGKPVSFLIQQANSKVKPIIHGDQITFQIQCKANVSLLMTESSIDVTDPSQLKQLEQRLADKIEGRIDMAMARARKAKADPFHFGQYIKWRYPQKWKTLEANWRDTFANDIHVDSHIDMTIKWLGAVKNPELNRILSKSEATP
jgi:spore germination protein KC